MKKAKNTFLIGSLQNLKDKNEKKKKREKNITFRLPHISDTYISQK